MDSRPIDPHSDSPPSRQIVERVLDAVARGELTAGDRLPSVRALAADALVNPNTVGKAYRELESLGVTAGKNGSGVYVTARGPAIARRLRQATTLDAFEAAVLGLLLFVVVVAFVVCSESRVFGVVFVVVVAVVARLLLLRNQDDISIYDSRLGAESTSAAFAFTSASAALPHARRRRRVPQPRLQGVDVHRAQVARDAGQRGREARGARARRQRGERLRR